MAKMYDGAKQPIYVDGVKYVSVNERTGRYEVLGYSADGNYYENKCRLCRTSLGSTLVILCPTCKERCEVGYKEHHRSLIEKHPELADVPEIIMERQWSRIEATCAMLDKGFDQALVSAVLADTIADIYQQGCKSNKKRAQYAEKTRDIPSSQLSKLDF